MKSNEILLPGQFFETPTPPRIGPQKRAGTHSLKELDQEMKAFFQNSAHKQRLHDLIRALVYLWHDHLDASHTISQGIEDHEGSYLHGIMHRRELDYGNAKYWFRRIGAHPVLKRVGESLTQALPAAEKELVSSAIKGGVLDPYAFVDLCEKAGSSQGEINVVLEKVQALEFRELLRCFLEESTAQPS